jgi:hypothetical protein
MEMHLKSRRVPWIRRRYDREGGVSGEPTTRQTVELETAVALRGGRAVRLRRLVVVAGDLERSQPPIPPGEIGSPTCVRLGDEGNNFQPTKAHLNDVFYFSANPLPDYY